MGKNTKIICTVVPNPYKTKDSNDDRYYFSVFLTPRLPESGNLKDYYEIVHWYEFWKFFRKFNLLNVRIAKISYEGTNYSFQDEISISPIPILFDDSSLKILKDKKGKPFGDKYSNIGENIYKKLFNEFTPVSGWILDEGEPNNTDIKQIISFDDLIDYYKDDPSILKLIRRGIFNKTSVSNLLYVIDEEKKKIAAENKPKPKDEPLTEPKSQPELELKEEIYTPSQSPQRNLLLRFEESSREDNYKEPPGTAEKDIDKNTFKKDTAGHNVSADEIRLRNKENQEFHKKLSILSSYPHLMRLTGWILDFYIEKNVVIEKKDTLNNIFNEIEGSNDKKMKNRAVIKLDFSNAVEYILKNTAIGDEFNELANFINEIDFKTPWTYFQPSDFSVKYSEVLQSKYFEIQNGFINNNEIPYSSTPQKLIWASQLDMKEFIGKQMQNPLTQLSEREKNQLKSNIEGSTISEPGKQSTGISVYIKPEILKVAIDNNPDIINLHFATKDKTIIKQLGEVNINDYIIFGHNLDTGYRIDVMRTSSPITKFFSLCKRVADYSIDTSPFSSEISKEYILISHEDEPWISESAQAGSSGTLYVDEELFRWNNWSLTCPHIGKYPQDEKNNETSIHDFNDIELNNIYPYLNEGSQKQFGEPILPLRFGQEYAFRIRVVDLCGNSPKSGDDTPIKMNSEEVFDKYLQRNSYIISTPPYKRFEKVEPIELFFDFPIYIERTVKNDYKEFQEDGSEREIRYVEKVKSLNPKYLGEDLKTLVIRSGVTPHGEIIYSKQECIRYISPARVTPQFAELHSVFDDFSDNNLDELYIFLSNERTKLEKLHKSGVQDITINFITDPIVCGVKLSWETGLLAERTFWPEFSLESDEMTYKNKVISTYFERKFVKLILNNETPSSTIRSEIAVSMLPGEFTLHSISPLVTKGMDSWRDKEGVDEGLTYLAFIHAVQRPIYIKDSNLNLTRINIVDLKPVDRTPNDPINVFMDKSDDAINLNLPLGTCGEIKLKGIYNEFIKKEFSTIDINNEAENGYEIASVETLVDFSFSNLDETSEGKEGQLSIPKLIIKEENVHALLSNFNKLKHSFGDTKYRKVTYKLELISRFKEFIDNRLNEDGFYSREFEIGTHKILNSQKPKALQIDRITPILSWSENSVGENRIITRTNDTFRVYFKDFEWFSTGEEECIAVLFKSSPTIDKEIAYPINTIEDGLIGLVTEFGRDPSVGKTNPAGGVQKEMLISGQPLVPFERESVNTSVLGRETSKFTRSDPASDHSELSFVKFPVKFNGKQFYCDILLKDSYFSDFYFPFMKFALARYQGNSITNYDSLKSELYDFRFSNIVVSSQVQVLPKREITINNNNREIRIETFGNIKLDSVKNTNEFWLIGESQVLGEFVNLLYIDSFTTVTTDNTKPRNCKMIENINEDYLIIDMFESYERLYIEEYEYYELGVKDKGGKEFSVKIDADYTPRNDIRKRLVFTYQIK